VHLIYVYLNNPAIDRHILSNSVVFNVKFVNLVLLDANLPKLNSLAAGR